MTTQSTEPVRSGPHTETSFGHFARGHYQAGNSIMFAVDEVLPIDPTAREIELPRSSVLFHHLASAAGSGGVVYLTAFGRRVAAVVHPEVAEAAERAEADAEGRGCLRELLADSEARLGPVPAEVQAEVDRQWHAALASM